MPWTVESRRPGKRPRRVYRGSPGVAVDVYRQRRLVPGETLIVLDDSGTPIKAKRRGEMAP